MNDRDELIEESVLRRSLRFEADEQVPRIDPRAIAALAEEDRPWMRAAIAALAAAGVTGVVSGTVWSAIASHGGQIVELVVNGLLDLLIALATLALPLAEIAAQPVVPLSLLAALGVAIIHELREREENAHVHAS